MKLMLISLYMIVHPAGVIELSKPWFIGAFPSRECREHASNLNASSLVITPKEESGRVVYFCTELPEK